MTKPTKTEPPQDEQPARATPPARRPYARPAVVEDVAMTTISLACEKGNPDNEFS